MSSNHNMLDDLEVAFSIYTSSDLRRAEWVYKVIGNSLLNALGTTFTQLALLTRFPIKPFLKPWIYKQFCGGEHLEECVPLIKKLASYSVGINLNYSIEAKNTEKDFDRTYEENIAAIEFAATHQSVHVLSIKPTGLINLLLLAKKQAGKTLTTHEENAYSMFLKRMYRICDKAARKKVQIYWDAEESWIQEIIDDVVINLMKTFNQKEAVIFNTFQLYRTDKLDYLKKCFEYAKKHSFILGAKLVRGAYVEKELAYAEEKNISPIIHHHKDPVDDDFNHAVNFCLEHIDRISVCIASHNEKSNVLAAQWIDEKGINRNHPNISFSQLLGMGETITFNLAKQGYNVTKYVPYGPVKEVIPYLIRRAAENTAVDGQIGRELDIIEKELNRRKIAGK